MLREDTHKKIEKEAKSDSSMHENYIHVLVSKMIVNEIFNEHEVQMKAKDEEIVELKLEVLSSFPKIANTKARKIIAMLFWKAKRQKKVFQRCYEEYGRNHSLTQNYRGMYEQAIMDFTKSYKILKDKQ